MSTLMKYGGKLKRAFDSKVTKKADVASSLTLTDTESFSLLLESGVQLLIHVKEA